MQQAYLQDRFCEQTQGRTLKRLAEQEGEERVLELGQQPPLAAAVRLAECPLQQRALVQIQRGQLRRRCTCWAVACS